MRERLIELITESHCVDTWNHYTDDFKDPNPIHELADYLLANGVIVTPCKVGDIVWNRKAEPYKVISLEWFSKKVTYLHCVSPVTHIGHTFAVGKRSLGKTVFLTKEEAENALKRKEDEGK